MCWLAPGWWRLEEIRPPFGRPIPAVMVHGPYFILFLSLSFKEKRISPTDWWWMSASSSSTFISMNEQQVKHITSRIAHVVCRIVEPLKNKEGHTQLSPIMCSTREPSFKFSFAGKKNRKLKTPFFSFSFFPWMKKKESELAIAQHCINIGTRIDPPWRWQWWHRVELLFPYKPMMDGTMRRRCMYKYEGEETRKRSMAFASVNGLTWWTGDLIRRGSNHCTIPKGVDINIRKLNVG